MVQVFEPNKVVFFDLLDVLGARLMELKSSFICLAGNHLGCSELSRPHSWHIGRSAILDAQMRCHLLIQMVLEVGLVLAIFGASQIVFDSLGKVSARFS